MPYFYGLLVAAATMLPLYAAADQHQQPHQHRHQHANTTDAQRPDPAPLSYESAFTHYRRASVQIMPPDAAWIAANNAVRDAADRHAEHGPAHHHPHSAQTDRHADAVLLQEHAYDGHHHASGGQQ